MGIFTVKTNRRGEAVGLLSFFLFVSFLVLSRHLLHSRTQDTISVHNGVLVNKIKAHVLF